MPAQPSHQTSFYFRPSAHVVLRNTAWKPFADRALLTLWAEYGELSAAQFLNAHQHLIVDWLTSY
jgi:hypothetical protein